MLAQLDVKEKFHGETFWIPEKEIDMEEVRNWVYHNKGSDEDMFDVRCEARKDDLKTEALLKSDKVLFYVQGMKFLLDHEQNVDLRLAFEAGKDIVFFYCGTCVGYKAMKEEHSCIKAEKTTIS
jgi:hypothetical protein